MPSGQINWRRGSSCRKMEMKLQNLISILWLDKSRRAYINLSAPRLPPREVICLNEKGIRVRYLSLVWKRYLQTKSGRLEIEQHPHIKWSKCFIDWE